MKREDIYTKTLQRVFSSLADEITWDLHTAIITYQDSIHGLSLEGMENEEAVRECIQEEKKIVAVEMMISIIRFIFREWLGGMLKIFGAIAIGIIIGRMIG